MDSLFDVIDIGRQIVRLLLIPTALLTKKRNPVSTTAWILLIAVFPLCGGLLFLLVGIDRIQRRITHKLATAREVAAPIRDLQGYRPEMRASLDEQQCQLIRLTRRVGGGWLTCQNRLELLDDANAAFASIEEAIRSARRTIHLEYYIWREDRTGTRLRDLLIEKAREGVSIRFLYDGVGSMFLSRRFLQAMRREQIGVASFLSGETFSSRWSLNFRSHRKIIVVDDRVAFTGGMNVGDEYLGQGSVQGSWRDTHLRIEGPAVAQLQQVFLEDWNFATSEVLDKPEEVEESDIFGPMAVQVVPSGPSDDTNAALSVMFAAICEARHHITLATSYFVPPTSLVTALESAAYRGVHVRLLLAGKSDIHWTVLASRSYYDSLLLAGVEIYEFQKTVLHSKTMTIDGKWSLVGSPNFDARSLVLNFEIAVAIYDTDVAAELESHFARDLEGARRVEPLDWENRSSFQVLSENFFRLMAPLI